MEKEKDVTQKCPECNYIISAITNKGHAEWCPLKDMHETN